MTLPTTHKTTESSNGSLEMYFSGSARKALASAGVFSRMPSNSDLQSIEKKRSMHVTNELGRTQVDGTTDLSTSYKPTQVWAPRPLTHVTSGPMQAHAAREDTRPVLLPGPTHRA